MNRKRQLAIGITAVLALALGVGLVGAWRLARAREFVAPQPAQTFGGTNYVVRLAETTAGRLDTGYVVVVSLQIENPNPYELTLERNWFVLVDNDHEYYLPSTTGSQTPLIKVAPHGVSEPESLSFTIGATGMEGALVLRIGQNRWAVIKSYRSHRPELAPGEYRSFRRRDW